jgi:hypothetical protein
VLQNGNFFFSVHLNENAVGTIFRRPGNSVTFEGQVNEKVHKNKIFLRNNFSR